MLSLTYYRQFCLLGYILRKCNCFYAKNDGPHRNDLLRIACGNVENKRLLAYPEEYNKSHCFEVENMVSLEECRRIFVGTFQDLLCVQRMKSKHMRQKERSKMPSNIDNNKCNCPEPCKYFSFNTFYSLAKWPINGPELDAAYEQLVTNILIPYIQSNASVNASDSHYETMLKHPLVREKVLQYLSNENNKREILSHYLRMTVYIKDLTIETIEDVEGYSMIDLISDVGE